MRMGSNQAEWVVSCLEDGLSICASLREMTRFSSTKGALSARMSPHLDLPGDRRYTLTTFFARTSYHTRTLITI